MTDGARDERAIARPLGERSAATDRVLGTYLHGLFENRNIRDAFVTHLFDRADITRPEQRVNQTDPFERAASLLSGELESVVLDVCSPTIQ